MLKITADRDAGRVVFKLEGRLTGPWVEELKICWQKSVAAEQPIKGVVLDEVTFIDEAGKELLADMHRQGVELTACSGCMTRAITEGIRRGESK
jgi:anti-anti-sigma regulatory factor